MWTEIIDLGAYGIMSRELETMLHVLQAGDIHLKVLRSEVYCSEP